MNCSKWVGVEALRRSTALFCIAVLVATFGTYNIARSISLRNKVGNPLVVSASGHLKTVLRTPPYPFNLTMTLEKAEYALEEHVKVKLRLTYLGDRNVTVGFGNPLFNFNVYNARGRHIYGWINRRGFDCGFYHFTWIPGEYMESTLEWEQTIGSYKGDQAPAGIYYIIGRTFNIDPKLQTPPIYIRIH